MKKLLFLGAFLTCLFINAQENVFIEEFSNNNNNWVQGNSNDRELKVFNGRYYFEHKKTKEEWTVSYPVKAINADENFEYETSIQKLSGVDNYGFGFFTFGGNTRLEFNLASQGYYRIDKYVNNKNNELVNWTKSNKIKTGNYGSNKLKIIKKGSNVSFYVNNTLLTSKTISNLKVSKIGIIIYKNQKISIDYIRLKKLAKEKEIVDIEENDNNGKTIFYDSFTNNKSNWASKNAEDIVYKFSNGKYYMQHTSSSGGYSSTIEKKFNQNQNFTIETKIDKISGETDYAYGIMFGKSGNNSYRFLISATGYYKYSRYVDNKEEKIIKWTKSEFINKNNGSSNVLKIKRKGNRILFFINNDYVNESSFESFYGYYIGYLLYNKQKIGIDYLKIEKGDNINNNKKNIANNKAIELPLAEDFSDNSKGWNVQNNNKYASKVEGGKFKLERKVKGGLFFQKEINIDTKKNFSIEAALTKTTGASNLTYGITFGRKNSSNEYSFFISNAGQYKYRKFDNDKYKSLIDWTDASMLNTSNGDTNVIKIVKTNNLLRFYINGSYVNEYQFEEFFGNQFGFTLYDAQKVNVEYVNIKYQSNTDNNPPIIVITEPNVEAKRGFKVVQAKKITVRGKAQDPDGIYEIFINGVEANVSEDGTFVANVPLKFGKNDLVVKATDIKNATSSKRFVIKRRSNIDDKNDDDDENDDNDIVDNKKLGNFGKYYALIIGVSDYEDPNIEDLEGKPTRDADTFATVLHTMYNFEKSNIIVLKNPKDNEINRELFKLRKKITNKDNLLVFYAGHGIFQDEIGSWLPSNAMMEYEENLFSNSKLVDHFKAIKSKHTLLISDACFSGSIFKTRSVKGAPKSVQRKFELPSKKAITSGTLKTVPNESVFFRYLIKRLKNNKSKYLSARKLFDMIEDPVINNSENKPQYGTIHGIGDEGGDFIFIKKM